MKNFAVVFFIVVLSPALAQRKTENLVIITLDGFRWQELFLGADSSILFDKRFTPDTTVAERFWDVSVDERRERLLPFFWNVMGKQGQLYGNRMFNNRVNCTNPFWSSYPGYSEMFTGLVDRRVRSNNKVQNPSATVFEFINSHAGFQGNVAAFSTWDVIPYIIRAQAANIPTNEGDAEAKVNAVQSGRQFENDQQQFYQKTCEMKDAYTFFLAFNFLKEQKPKVLYISFDETDAQAHGGRYGNYLRAANQIDQMVAQLWGWLQTHEPYKGTTTLLLTTDHGRGGRSSVSWKKHGRLTTGAGQIWFAVIGPDTPAVGEMKTPSLYFQKQFAKTAAGFLGLDYQNESPIGDKIHTMYLSTEVTVR